MFRTLALSKRCPLVALGETAQTAARTHVA